MESLFLRDLKMVTDVKGYITKLSTIYNLQAIDNILTKRQKELTFDEPL